MGNEEDVAFLIAYLTARGLSIRQIEQHLHQYLIFAAAERHIPIPDVTFDLESMPEALCVDRFRFNAAQIKTMVRALSIPDIIKSAQRVPVPAIEAFCLMLRRLSYPCRYRDLVFEFGRHPSVLSSVFNAILLLVHSRIAVKVEFDEHIFTTYTQACATSVYRKCGYLRDCLGYIDGTARQICRPVEFQREVYSDHKKIHCLKYQGVMMANGLLVALFGPVEGRRHDMFLLSESGLEETFVRLFPGRYLYGDAGYGLKEWLIRPFQMATLPREKSAFNKAMSAGRVSVEWFFGEVVQYWGYVDFKKGMKIGKSPLAAMYIVAVFLTNALMCARGSSKSAAYFECPLPTLDEYLRNVDRHAFPGDDSNQVCVRDDDDDDKDVEVSGATVDTSTEHKQAEDTVGPPSQPTPTQMKPGTPPQATPVIPTLSPSQSALLNGVLFGGSLTEVVAESGNASLTRKCIQCLLPDRWLNDEVVNAWLRLLQARDGKLHTMGLNRGQSLFLNTFFFSSLTALGYNYLNVQRWTRQVRLW